MRIVTLRRIGRYAGILLALAVAVPLFNGCSTLGIATADDLTAMESSTQNSNNATNARIDNLEKRTADMQAMLTQLTANVDTLNVRFARAKTWIETMNIDTISSDSQKATEAAMSAEARSRLFLDQYFAWIKAQSAALDEQIKKLEAQMNQSPAGDAKKPEEKPKETGGGDSSD